MTTNRKTLLYNILVAVIAMVAIVYIFPRSEASQYKYEKGRPWNYAKLIAPFDIPIRPDSDMIIKVRDSLDSHFVPVYRRNARVGDSVITLTMQRWKTMADSAQPSEREQKLRRNTIAYLKNSYTRDILDSDNGKMVESGQLPVIKIMENNTVKQFPTAGMASVDDIYRGLLASYGDSSALRWAQANRIYDNLLPTLTYDEESSRRLYNNELYRFTAIRGVIQQGQTIIDKGTIITAQDYTNLRTYEELLEVQSTGNTQSDMMIWIGQVLYVSLVLALLMIYLHYSAPKVWGRRSSMLFICLLVVVFFALGVAGDHFTSNGIYMVPFAIVPVLLIVFFDAPVAIYTSLSLIMLCAAIVTFPLEFVMVELPACIVAVFSLKGLDKRSQLLRTSLFVALAYLVSYVAVEMLMNGSLKDISTRMISYLMVSALFSSVAYILMVVIERAFGFVSTVTLIELCDVNMPLLRKLSEQCPGTFQHSMAVSTLAADAAMKIGANEQLVRAGALYHDIGKLSNPNFFTENQRGVNPHDALPPERSAEIIIQHVTDGEKRAVKAGLPQIIIDFIREHHGRGTAKYFYYTYCNAHPNEEVDAAPFTYPGPNPHSRETSLLMMADSVEAASRSLKEHTPKAIAELVNRIIDSQIADGLHNDSSLSFRDVELIKKEFVKRLTTIYHSRIQYPDQPSNTDPKPAEPNPAEEK